MLLAEVFSSDIDYTVEKDARSLFVTSATIGGREVIFSAHAEDGEWEVTFGEIRKDGKKTFAASGSGSATQVGAFVKKSLEEFLARHHPMIVFFTADSTTRSNVYQKVAAKVMGRYKSSTEKAGENTIHRFVYKMNEAFDSAYEFKKNIDTIYGFKTEDGSEIDVEFDYYVADSKRHDPKIWKLEFTRNGFTRLTGEGDAMKILSTVTAITKEFVRDKSPGYLIFEADKGEKSRSKVYRHMLRRIKIPHYRQLDIDKLHLIGDSGIEAKLESILNHRTAHSEVMLVVHEDELQGT